MVRSCWIKNSAPKCLPPKFISFFLRCWPVFPGSFADLRSAFAGEGFHAVYLKTLMACRKCVYLISHSQNRSSTLSQNVPQIFSDLQLSGWTSSEIFRVSDDQIPSPGNPSKSHGSLPTTMSESKLFGHCRRFAEGLIPPIYIYLYLLRPYYRTAGKPFGGTDFHEMYLGDISGNSME